MLIVQSNIIGVMHIHPYQPSQSSRTRDTSLLIQTQIDPEGFGLFLYPYLPERVHNNLTTAIAALLQHRIH